MDKNILDSFFDTFNGEMEEHRINIIRRNDILLRISEIIESRLTKEYSKNISKPRKFNNPYLYYRMDINNISSIYTIANDLKDLFANPMDDICIGDDELEYYIAYPPKYKGFDEIEFEEMLLIKIVSSRNGTTAIELMLVENPSVISFSDKENGFEVCYLIDSDLALDFFVYLKDGIYVCDDLIFIPEESKSPFDSIIKVEQ